MSRSIARWVMDLTADALPPARRRWARAMRAELDHVGDGGEAIRFAFGCLIAACRERCRSLTGADGARLAFAGVTFALAAFHLNCAADGMRILSGGVDPFHAALVRAGPAYQATAEQWRSMTPVLTIGLAALGSVNLLAALFAFRAMPAHFVRAMGGGLLAALAMAALILGVLGPDAGLWSFLAVAGIQAALSALIWRFCMNATTASGG